MPSESIKRLDFNTKHPVSYCVENWVRDEQIRLAIKRVQGRIQASTSLCSEPIALVSYGPSLAQTWERLREFKYIITCSGAHRFILEKGIIPIKGQWWHVEVDPRPHKAKLIGPPHLDVEYLIASACHPAVFDLLEGFNVKLWHIFANDAEAMRTLPHEEWAITGGCSVGLRTMTIARFMGFTNLHIFGMDGCEGATGKHAGEHPNQPAGHSITTYDGVDYRTTISMMECAKETFHELNQMPDVTATFYGEGLVQHMARNYKPAPTQKAAHIAIAKPNVISAEYCELNRKLHRESVAYGVGGGKHASVILKLAENLKTTSILDYGCGKGYLAKAIPFPIWEYDPAVPGKEESPRPAHLVVCTDVLEHIEPDKLNVVLDDLRRCTQKVGYFVIHTGPSSKTLADGRNSHLIQQGPEWWGERLKQFFQLQEGSLIYRKPLLYVVVAPKPKLNKAA